MFKILYIFNMVVKMKKIMWFFIIIRNYCNLKYLIMCRTYLVCSYIRTVIKKIMVFKNLLHWLNSVNMSSFLFLICFPLANLFEGLTEAKLKMLEQSFESWLVLCLGKSFKLIFIFKSQPFKYLKTWRVNNYSKMFVLHYKRVFFFFFFGMCALSSYIFLGGVAKYDYF